MTASETKRIREEHYPSCRQAAKAWGVHPTTWQRYESGHTPTPKPVENWLALKGLGDKREEG